MNLRDLAERYPQIGWCLAGLLLVAFTLTCYARFKPPKPAPPMVWYYDVGSAALFAARSAEPPIAAPSGQEGVLAHVFACGNCADEGARVIAYLESDSPEFHQATTRLAVAGQLASPSRQDMLELAAVPGGRLVAKPEPTLNWVGRNTDEGLAILQAPVDCPPGRQARQCPAR